MPANKKRPKLPEEDLAAAVADMINSPITRSNLSFLHSPPDPQPPPYGTVPLGVEQSPRAVDIVPTVSDRYGMVGSVSTPPALGPTPDAPVEWQPRRSNRTLWEAEGLGTVFEQTRVRRIQHAKDALSLVEEKVYDLLWGTKSAESAEFRLVHYSLQRTSTEARINIKTVRELIPRLIDKGFLAVEHPADVRRNIPTLYRVWSYPAVLKQQRLRNRLHVAKTGKGVFYVHPVSASFGLGPLGDDPSSWGTDTPPPVSEPVGDESDTAGRERLAAVIHEALRVTPDDDLLAGMIAACHRNALASTGEAATEDELLYFTATKAQVIARASNIRNHLAVLRKAVPDCFLGESFRAYRAASGNLRRQAAAKE